MIRHRVAASLVFIVLAASGCKEPLDLVGEPPAAAAPTLAAESEPATAQAPAEAATADAEVGGQSTPEPVDDSPPATEAECRASFDGLVRTSIAGTRSRWQRLGRGWSAEASAEIEATMRDTEVSHLARCMRSMTQKQAACQSAARSVASWHLCTARSKRQR